MTSLRFSHFALALATALAPHSAPAAEDLRVTVIVPAVQPRPQPSDYAFYRDHLVAYEGYRTRPYRDGDGWSVGIGHSLTQHREAAIWTRPYTAAEIEALYARDISWTLDACRRGVAHFDDLPPAVRQVCVGVAFTVGRTGFDHFVSFRLALSYRAYDAAAVELNRSRWADQVSPARHNSYIRILKAAR